MTTATNTASRYGIRRADLGKADLAAGLEAGWLVIETRANGNTYEIETWDTRRQARAASTTYNRNGI